MGAKTVVVKTAGAAKGIGSTFVFLRKFAFFSLLFVVFLIIFSNAIIMSVEQKSFEPLLNELGGRFFLASQSLETASLDAIERGGIYDPAGPWYGDVWEFVSNLSELIFAVMVIWMWLRVLMWIVKKTPLSDESRWFTNFTLALLTFIVLEAAFILIKAAVAGEITDYRHALYLVSLPVRSFYSFFLALKFIFSPFASAIGDKMQPTNKLNDTLTTAINSTINGTS